MSIVQEANRCGKMDRLWSEIEENVRKDSSSEHISFFKIVKSTMLLDHSLSEAIPLEMRDDLFNELWTALPLDISGHSLSDAVIRMLQGLSSHSQANKLIERVKLFLDNEGRRSILPSNKWLLWIILEQIWDFSQENPSYPCFIKKFIQQFKSDYIEYITDVSKYEKGIQNWLFAYKDKLALLEKNQKAPSRADQYPKSIYYSFYVTRDVESVEKGYYRINSWIYQGEESGKEFDVKSDYIGNNVAQQSMNLPSIIECFNKKFAEFQRRFEKEIFKEDVDVVIEFTVPEELLNENFHKWEQPHLKTKTEYGFDYIVIVRPEYRLSLQPGNRTGWITRWNRIIDLLEYHWKDSIQWKPQPTLERGSIAEDELFVGFEQPLIFSEEDNSTLILASYIESGVPIMVWCNDKSTLNSQQNFAEQIIQLVEEGVPLKSLPKKLQYLRKRNQNEDSLALSTVLLWDNPYRFAPTKQLYDDPQYQKEQYL
ncbi:hypothetical protein KC887_01715 [Candidatus Kaiserbacteria bacterium]|nr:hypothetical protein [Candidatus Kaiserbacteria bacterium]